MHFSENIAHHGLLIELNTLEQKVKDGRYSNIYRIRDLRLSSPLDYPERFETVCNSIPNTVKDGDGYHRECYKKFAGHLSRLEKAIAKCEDQFHRSPRKTTKVDKIIFSPNCLVCDT